VGKERDTRRVTELIYVTVESYDDEHPYDLNDPNRIALEFKSCERTYPLCRSKSVKMEDKVHVLLIKTTSIQNDLSSLQYAARERCQSAT
jgi:hypothetical protein